MEFPKDIRGSSFRWNDSPWGEIGRFRPSPESNWYHLSIFNAGGFFRVYDSDEFRISPILKNACHPIAIGSSESWNLILLIK